MGDKKLLLTDLSARFPYNVALNCKDEYDDKVNFTCYLTSDILRQLANNDCMWTYRPYLYPLSSMTEEQKNSCPISETNLNIINSNIGCYGIIEIPWKLSYLFVDWCNKNHFDYRGLIEQGLAIDATNLKIY